jgi:hypothetical protein
MTKSGCEIVERARGYHLGDKPAEYRHFLCVNRELHAERHSLLTEHPHEGARDRSGSVKESVKSQSPVRAPIPLSGNCQR